MLTGCEIDFGDVVAIRIILGN